ncbi:MAG: NAD synthetase [Verrucomicrobia bacterium GWF2_51_19]|nr:MAG: NAD synthetase [Verrucomicrobia bacterium GWF2_51_19]HCJ12496.1 NAD synthetase [Opitutae bacterium]
MLTLAYIIASILFIFGIKMLGSAAQARRGNVVSAVGMLIAIVATMMDQHVLSYTWILAGIAIGSALGIVLAYSVKMTAMPEMVALLNGFGGLGSLLVGWAEAEEMRRVGWPHYLENLFGPELSLYDVNLQAIDWVAKFSNEINYIQIAIASAIIIGGITFTGSVLAYAKLSGMVSGRAMVFKGQKPFNAFLLLAMLAATVLFVQGGQWAHVSLFAIIIVSLVLGILGVLPIGGGDMPVVISLLNSLSGLAAAAAGFIIANNVLIVSGCLVGTSGIILSVIMCKAMNRSLKNVLVGGFGSSAQEKSDGDDVEPKAISASDAYHVLEAAQRVVFVPGYGMAVAQAQHVVKELGQLLENNGAEVSYAIHPVAGRMPGHMNVLLAEADVPYEQLVEMDTVNPTMPSVDVAIVIGANDVVNPAAINETTSPIYGMPIIRAHEAKSVFILKRGQGTGFSGLQNKLFTMPNASMIYGDAKATVAAIVSEFKSM